MGLDITAYKDVTKLDGVKYIDGEVYDATLSAVDDDKFDFVVYVADDFPGRQGSLEDYGVYKSGDSFGFRAGSYSGYNSWRNKLAELAGYELGSYEQYGREWPSHAATAWKATSGPFWELINFSDCEGTIGPEASAKLLKDFQEFEAEAEKIGGDFFEKYQDLKQAFEMAAQNGAVKFH